MPRGIFLLVHDEIKGPIIKASYFKTPFELPQEFIRKLYMSHSGFESASYLEMKFNHHIVVSFFTGHLARRSNSEGIIGVVFDDNEKIDNLELFLKRTLATGLTERTNQTMKEIFSKNLLKFLYLNQFFDLFEIENISEILIIKGKKEFNSTLLEIGEKKISNTEIGAIYLKMLESEQIPKIKYQQLKIPTEDNVFLVFKLVKTSRNIEKIIHVLASYIENFFEYALELMALFLLPNVIKVQPLEAQLHKRYPDDEVLLQILHKSKNYDQEFNSILSSIIKNNLYISPITL